MELKFFPFRLQLRETFRIARGSRDYTPLVLVEIHHENMIGYGEASMPSYLGESQDSAMEFLKKLNLNAFDSPVVQMDEILEYIASVDQGQFAAKASVDIALHDLAGKLTNRSCSELLRVDRVDFPNSFYTLGIATPEVIARKIENLTDFNLIKIKLGGEYDREVIQKVMESPYQFCIDVNQGWRDLHQASKMVDLLEGSRCEYIEQPFPVDMTAETSRLTERTTIPVIADESIKTSEDLKNISGIFDGINIKLMKSGGLSEARKMIDMARGMDLKVALGSMTETSCAITAAAHLSPLVDWADLDSPYLTANDPFHGMRIINGRISIDRGKPGIGIEKITDEE